MPKAKHPKPRGPVAEDKALGEKIRARRNLAGMSQDELGGKLGVSFQQVQKYEKGVNRVGAVRLEQIATALGESLAYFQSSAPVSKAGAEMQTLMFDPLNLRLLRSFAKLENQKLRFHFAQLVEMVVDGK